MEFNLSDSSDSQNLVLTEGKRKGVLAEVRGPFCFEDVPSRNKRVYPKGSWKAALAIPETKRMLEDGLMLGTVGHDDVDFDTLIREGKVSHRTKSLVINEEGVGIGVAEILDTPVGRILNTLIRSGCNMYVSTKATGSSKERDIHQNDIVTAETLRLGRIDFVTDPGFLKANPRLREQLEEVFKAPPDKDALTEVLKEVLKLESQSDGEVEKREVDIKKILENQKQDMSRLLDSQTDDIKKSIKEEHKEGSIINSDGNSNLKEDVQMDEKVTNSLEKVLTEKVNLEAEVASLIEEGSASRDEVKRLLVVEGEAQELRTINETLTENSSELNELTTEFGDITSIRQCLELAESIAKEFGTIEDIKKVYALVEEYQEQLKGLGSPADIEANITSQEQELEEYREIGTPEAIQTAFEKGADFILQQKDNQIEEAAQDIASRFGIVDKKVVKLLENNTKKEVEDLLEDLIEDAVDDSDTDEEDYEDESGEETKLRFKKSNKTNEDSEARLDRMYEAMGGVKIKK